MSRAHLLVRFPDGEVREGIYEGTSDSVPPWLTTGDSWELIYPLVRPVRETSPNFQPRAWDEAPDGEIYDVEIYSGYGYGWVMPGRSARNVIMSPLIWNDFTGTETWKGADPDDRPDWVRAHYANKGDES